MSSTLTAIARTISDELERAVAAAEDAQNTGLDIVSAALKTSVARFSETVDAASELEREAAQLVAKAIKLRESAQKELLSDFSDASEKIKALRADSPRRINGKKSKAPATIEAPAND